MLGINNNKYSFYKLLYIARGYSSLCLLLGTRNELSKILVVPRVMTHWEYVLSKFMRVARSVQQVTEPQEP